MKREGLSLYSYLMSWMIMAATILASSSYSYDDKPKTIQARSRFEFEATTHVLALPGIMER